MVTISRYSLGTSQVVIFFSGRVHMSVMDLTRSSRWLPAAGKGIFPPRVFLVVLNMVSDLGGAGDRKRSGKVMLAKRKLALHTWKMLKNKGFNRFEVAGLF